MSEAGERVLRQSYSEIIHGFSITNHKGSNIFVRHFSAIDNLEIDFLYTENFNETVSKGYPTEGDRLAQLKKDHLWTDGDENNIEGIKTSMKSMIAAKKKAFLKRDIDSINQQIADQEKLLLDMLSKREFLVGQTAEKATRRKVDSHLIYKSLFFDSDFKKPINTKEEFDELDANEMSDLFRVYNKIMDNFSETNIKKIALSPFFQNAFYLTESVYEFYGKPICFLTNFQVQLTAYGNYYKSILTGPIKPPDDLLNDPEKLEDWHSGKTNADEVIEKAGRGDNDNISIMGATEEDLKSWGHEQQGISLAQATRDAGGTMDMEALLKLHGVD